MAGGAGTVMTILLPFQSCCREIRRQALWGTQPAKGYSRLRKVRSHTESNSQSRSSKSNGDCMTANRLSEMLELRLAHSLCCSYRRSLLRGRSVIPHCTIRQCRLGPFEDAFGVGVDLVEHGLIDGHAEAGALR